VTSTSTATVTPLAVQLYSVRDQMRPDPRPVLQQLAGAGYGAVEGYDPLHEPESFRSLLDELGLVMCSTHAPVLGDRQAEVLTAAATLGTDTVIAPSAPRGLWDSAQGLDELAGQLNDAARKAAEHGITIGYHNHGFEFEHHIDGAYALEALAERLDPAVILELDTYWAHVAGADVVALLGRLGSRVRFLHVKDGPGTAKDPMTAVGTGVLDVPAILHANPAVRWHVVELDECATDMVTALAQSAEYLSREGVR